MQRIITHKKLEVYKLSYQLAMEVFVITKGFPKEEIYCLTAQIRNSSRSVPANIAEAFRKRRYPKSFVSKLSDAEGESAETQTWLDFAVDCGYLSSETRDRLNKEYNHILAMLVTMITHPEKWSL